jgi:hypothetical protein
MGIVMRMGGVLLVSATTVMGGCGGNKDAAGSDSAAPAGTVGQSGAAGAPARPRRRPARAAWRRPRIRRAAAARCQGARRR